jgi:hypothetical protein
VNETRKAEIKPQIPFFWVCSLPIWRFETWRVRPLVLPRLQLFVVFFSCF